ncbi:MAG: hypothetical protein ACNA7J_06720 [Wenzhouxiangella sp.]
MGAIVRHQSDNEGCGGKMQRHGQAAQCPVAKERVLVLGQESQQQNSKDQTEKGLTGLDGEHQWIKLLQRLAPREWRCHRFWVTEAMVWTLSVTNWRSIDIIFSVSHFRVQSATFVAIECGVNAPIRDSTALNRIAIVHPPVEN